MSSTGQDWHRAMYLRSQAGEREAMAQQIEQVAAQLRVEAELLRREAALVGGGGDGVRPVALISTAGTAAAERPGSREV